MGKVTVIIGEPATGKSTIMKKIITNHGPWKWDPTIKFIPCHWQSPDMCIIGRYDDMEHQFPGTDRMSMACQDYVTNFIRDNPRVNFIMEGDRLGTQSFLWGMREMDTVELQVFHLWLNQTLHQDRHELREQSETFLKSRRTKVQNLLAFCTEAKIPVVSYQSSFEADANFAASELYTHRLQH